MVVKRETLRFAVKAFIILSFITDYCSPAIARGILSATNSRKFKPVTLAFG